MVEKQRILMQKTKEYLEMLLDADEDMLYPSAGIFMLYSSYLAELALEFPNQETLALGIDLMDMIYNARDKADICWFIEIERMTVIMLGFTDLSDMRVHSEKK